ncbi:MAG TPA: hypothetical protein VJ204_01540 [Solirubrobacterales bacterium]|nr:hypothetical protein [Solirubrobacterales bacterium]
MRFRHFLLAPLALLVVALVVAGCGGGGSSSTTTTVAKKKTTVAQLSKAGFISQGDAICAEVNTAVGSTEESAAEASVQTSQVANLYTGMVESIQRLGQPSEKDGYSEFMGAAEKLAMVEDDLKKAGEEEDLVAEEEAAGESGPALEEFQQQAAVYGFEDCAEGPHAPEPSPESVPPAGEESVAPEESGGIESLPEEEVAPEEEFVPEEEVAPEEEFVPEAETGGAGGEIEEVPEEVAPEESNESGGIGPG